MKYSAGITHYFLASMVKACERIFSHVAESTYEEFAGDERTRDAVERQFQLLGECVRRIPFSIQKKWKQIPWNSMYRLRNRIAHEFYDVDPEMLWHIIKNDLNKNKIDLEELIGLLAKSPTAGKR